MKTTTIYTMTNNERKALAQSGINWTVSANAEKTMHGQTNNKKTNNNNNNNGQTNNGLKDLIATYNRQTNNGLDSTDTLQTLAFACVCSVLKKLAKTSYNPTIDGLRKSVHADRANFSNVIDCVNNATKTTINKAGDSQTVIDDKSANDALETVLEYQISDAYDLVQTALLTILEQTNRQRKNGENIDLERPYQVRQLKKKVYIKKEDSANGWETITTTPIQEIYKAIRRDIINGRGLRTDPKNGYTYIEDIATDSENKDIETIIYLRTGKYADIGGTVRDYNGKETAYTADKQTYDDVNELVGKMNLSERQALVLSLRMRGYGYKAIGTYTGVDCHNVARICRQIQAKAEKIGLSIK